MNTLKNYYIVLIEPEDEGNIGAVARVMKNFGFSNLVLINPKCEIGKIGKIRAKHGLDILENSRVFEHLNQFIKELDIIIGTSGKKRKSFKEIIFPSDLPLIKEKVGILFGRESIGLLDSEIKLCDILVKIPTNSEYPILNLSHAVGIVLYEIYKKTMEKKEPISLNGINKVLKDPKYRILKNLILRGRPNNMEINNILGLFRKKN